VNLVFEGVLVIEREIGVDFVERVFEGVVWLEEY
jgi:hypothetical protein